MNSVTNRSFACEERIPALRLLLFESGPLWEDGPGKRVQTDQTELLSYGFMNFFSYWHEKNVLSQ